MEVRWRREAEERHARDYEERLHDRWKAEDGIRQKTDRRFTERLALKEEELAHTKREVMHRDATDLLSYTEVKNNVFAGKRKADAKRNEIVSN